MSSNIKYKYFYKNNDYNYIGEYLVYRRRVGTRVFSYYGIASRCWQRANRRNAEGLFPCTREEANAKKVIERESEDEDQIYEDEHYEPLETY